MISGISSALPPLPPMASSDAVGAAANTPLQALTDATDSPARPPKPLGNVGGALSWPVPMPEPDQRRLIALLGSDTSGVPGLPLADGAKGLLSYLLSGSSVTDADLETPGIALEKLLGSSKAQALGRALQTQLSGVPTEGAGNDYVLAALQLSLDPQTQAAPTRNNLAGFDLTDRQYKGQAASKVVQAFSQHLIATGRATPKTAGLAAYLLLARTAPEFLVKGIPPSVTYGSVMWAQLAMAVARNESHTLSGKPDVGYAEILLASESLDIDAAVNQHISYEALKDWGVANGLLVLADGAPAAGDIERVRGAYNSQLDALKTASTLLQTPIPSREAMALAQLEAAFPLLDKRLFREKTFWKANLKEGRPGLYPGARSMLDIVMGGGKLGANDHWISNDKRLPVDAFCALYEAGKLGVAESFQAAYDAAIKAHEEGHHRMVRHLINTLASPNGSNLMEGKLDFFHTNDYKIAIDLLTPPALHKRGHTLEVKTTTEDGEVNLYVIDTHRGVIEEQNFLIGSRTPPYTRHKMETRDANILSKTVPFEADDAQSAQQFAKRPAGGAAPDHGNSARSHAIADLFVRSLDLKNDDLLKQARGVTSYDEDSASNQAIAEFFLNLIPLRSAIVNFKDGNVGQGIFDLAVDAVGLLTMGAGKAAQAGKVLAATTSTARQAAKVVRFVGANVVQAFNPLSGVGDLLVGGGRLAASGSRYVAAKVRRQLDQLKGASAGYDLLKAASKQYGEAATGSFKVAGEHIEGGAVRLDGNWYALDAQTMRPYGRALDDFVPVARAVDGKLTQLPTASEGALSNMLFRELKVPESRIAGLSRNSQGVYVAADGHLSHIRHTDSAGQSAVYEVRQVTRGADGQVQARVYHNNRQTPLLLQHVEGDQWRRLGQMGGSPPSIKADLGPVIGRGGEGIVYSSLDGKRAYKDFGPTQQTPTDFYDLAETRFMNQYYGDGFARTVVEDGRKYLVMGRVDGVDLGHFGKGGLPPQARSLLADTFAQMEAKGIYHNDMQLKNYMYSARDNKIYPVDLGAMPPEVMTGQIMIDWQAGKQKVLREYAELIAKES